ncbi:protein of unknown function [Sterolibacterium denitrificans]|uniref:Uncharacterized protein n=1 Tax=Sterolibacterium denitrificans TaxID=157592 RepID=A0A7Z7HT64_9PROT|nr:protein of unknown function [Sterolibacterium denitrificans]
MEWIRSGAETKTTLDAAAPPKQGGPILPDSFHLAYINSDDFRRRHSWHPGTRVGCTL